MAPTDLDHESPVRPCSHLAGAGAHSSDPNPSQVRRGSSARCERGNTAKIPSSRISDSVVWRSRRKEETQRQDERLRPGDGRYKQVSRQTSDQKRTARDRQEKKNRRSPSNLCTTDHQSSTATATRNHRCGGGLNGPTELARWGPRKLSSPRPPCKTMKKRKMRKKRQVS